ncbi:MAG: PhoH family protein, partial [Fidelibacterota bacterium]
MKKTIEIKGADLQTLFGAGDAHLAILESHFSAKIIVRGNAVILEGDELELDQIRETLHEMIQTISRKGHLSRKDVTQLITVIQAENGQAATPVSHVIHYGRKGA